MSENEESRAMSGESQLVRKEQISGGIVAVCVASFEILLKAVLGERWGRWTILLLLATLGGCFYAVYWWIGWVLTRWQLEEKRRLEDFMKKELFIKGVGSVRGNWIDAIWESDTEKPFECSIIRIESSRETGFEINGDTYYCHYEGDKAYVDSFAGHFHGVAPPSNESKILFMAKGGEGPKTAEGVTTYDFRREINSVSSDDESEKYFQGYFTTDGRTRYVLGRKIKPDETFATADERNAHLQEFLTRPMVLNHCRKRPA